jgi:Ca2+-binding RTX toxin-like protein
MSGGAGNDIYVVDTAGDMVIELAGEGTDVVWSGLTYTLPANAENLVLTGSSAVSGTGNGLDNVLTGNAANNSLSGGSGNDTIDGGAGNDTMTGGSGNDTFFVDSTGDTVSESSSGGTDTVFSSATWTLSTNVENLTLTGTVAIGGTGNTLANVIAGNGAANALNGGSGADTLVGAGGDDVYTVDNTGDLITEVAGEGTDNVSSSVTYSLAANVENLTLTGTSGLGGTGNALNNSLVGNSGANSLSGGDGNDTIDGGTGNDTMVGGNGDDTFYVNVSTDVVTEASGGGTDTVISSVTLTLGSNVENLTLTGSSALNGTGNALANLLIGNTGNNSLSGGDGNDTLDGGTGTDTMVGGNGDDTFYVNVSTDVITEGASAGADTVMSTITCTLATNFENLTLTGTSAINGTGNSVANILIGNSAVNTLAGAAGDDTYDGAAGNDFFSDTSTTSNDTYRWGIGSGLDTLADAGGSLDHVDLFAGVARADLRFAQNSNHLEVTISGQTDKLTISNWFASSANRIEEFRLSDGSKVLASEVPSLLGAGMFMMSATQPESSAVGRKFAHPIRLSAELTADQFTPHRILRDTVGPLGMNSIDDRALHILVSAMATFGARDGAIADAVAPPAWQRVVPHWASPHP